MKIILNDYKDRWLEIGESSLLLKGMPYKSIVQDICEQSESCRKIVENLLSYQTRRSFEKSLKDNSKTLKVDGKLDEQTKTGDVEATSDALNENHNFGVEDASNNNVKKGDYDDYAGEHFIVTSFQREMSKYLAKNCVLDWKNISDTKGNEIPYDEHKCAALLFIGKDVYSQVVIHYLDEQEGEATNQIGFAEDVKKS